jgi:hypothetical protein
VAFKYSHAPMSVVLEGQLSIESLDDGALLRISDDESAIARQDRSTGKQIPGIPGKP